MKSIMEEASSVIKAIEKGWVQAGKPQEFTIKVFEEATKNFLGITTKPAKIGIFFTEKAAPAKHIKSTRPQREEQPRQPMQQPRKQPAPVMPQQKAQRPTQPVEAPQEKKPRAEVWSPELVEFVQEWIRESLILMGKPTEFSVEVKNYYLKINFSHAVMEDREKERFLFRNFAYLVMQSLRNKFKKNFRGFKIILSS